MTSTLVYHQTSMASLTSMNTIATKDKINQDQEAASESLPSLVQLSFSPPRHIANETYEEGHQTPRWEGVDEIVLRVLTFFDVSDVVKSKRVNKRWQKLCQEAVDTNFPPKKKFKTNKELRGAVKKYCRLLKLFKT